MGGGLGIVYDKEKPQTAQQFARKIMPLLKGINLKLILEPGRFIMGNAGILVTKILYMKHNYNKQFIIVDAAMNDLIRPSLYSAYHKIIPLRRISSKAAGVHRYKMADIVGPICESGDFLGKNRKITVKEGDYLAVMGAGAYGFSMSSNYNSRPRAAEILVKGRKAHVIRERETYQDLTARERLLF
jgi:diaminopimelate decarboxylase